MDIGKTMSDAPKWEKIFVKSKHNLWGWKTLVTLINASEENESWFFTFSKGRIAL